MIYLKYLSYVLRHKWFVFLACCQMGIVWRGIVHDLSKFRPSEFIPYARHFYGDIKKRRYETGSYDPTVYDNDFALAWLHHQRRNPHHWQYWVEFKGMRDGLKVYEMPEQYRKEMMADWIGAGRAQGTPSVKAWFEKNRGNIWLEDETAEEVLTELGLPWSEE